MNKKGQNNVTFGIILIIFSLAAIIESLRMPTYGHMEGLYAAPGLVPLFLAGSLLLMGISVMVSGLRAGGRIKLKFARVLNADAVGKAICNDSTQRMILALGYITLYVFGLLGRLPYMVATGIFLFAFLFSFSAHPLKKRITSSLLISVITSVVVYYSFTELFLIPLP